ncbi:MAG: hypothetical protein ACJ8AW_52365, partial [Rhodopila sp.]
WCRHGNANYSERTMQSYSRPQTGRDIALREGRSYIVMAQLVRAIATGMCSDRWSGQAGP